MQYLCENQTRVYEKLQIESMLQDPHTAPERGMGVFLMSKSKFARRVFEVAVAPAMHENGMEMLPVSVAFDSSSQLSELTKWLRRAVVIVCDLSEVNADLMYVLGLAHGMGRCPLMTVRSAVELPFNLAALRYIEYDGHRDEDLIDLRGFLARAIRVFLTATRSER